MEVGPKEVFFYELPNGKCPFKQWLSSLKDPEAVAKVQIRIKQVEESGNLGSYKYLEAGVSEFKFAGRRHGHLRVYYAEINSYILVLNGGHHDNQSRDIEKAKRYLVDYEQREGQDKS